MGKLPPPPPRSEEAAGGYDGAMTHEPSTDPVEPQVEQEESLEQTDVQGQLDEEPDTQENRRDAPDWEDLPGSPTGE